MNTFLVKLQKGELILLLLSLILYCSLSIDGREADLYQELATLLDRSGLSKFSQKTFPSRTVVEHLQESILGQLDEKERVIVVLATIGSGNLIQNLEESIRRVRRHQSYCLIALDKDTENYALSRELGFGSWLDRTLRRHHYLRPANRRYYRVVMKKIIIALLCSLMKVNCLLVDVDVVFTRDPFSLLDDLPDSYDLATQVADPASQPISSSIFFTKGGDKMSVFWANVLEAYTADETQSFQTLLNRQFRIDRHDLGITVKPFDNRYFANGPQYLCKCDGFISSMIDDVFAVHFGWSQWHDKSGVSEHCHNCLENYLACDIKGDRGREVLMREADLWFVADEMRLNKDNPIDRQSICRF